MGERTQCRFCCRYPDEVDGTNCMWCSGYRAGRASTSTADRAQLVALVEAARMVHNGAQQGGDDWWNVPPGDMVALIAALAEVDRG